MLGEFTPDFSALFFSYHWQEQGAITQTLGLRETVVEDRNSPKLD